MEMTQEQQEFEVQQAEAFFGGGRKNSGYLVTTKAGLTGITYHKDQEVNGKVKVYTSKGNLLCEPNSLTLNGFID